MITKKTKLLVINNPSNPTGALLPPHVLREIAELAEKKGVLILSDEIYEFFSYDHDFVSMGALSGDALILGGFSKAFGVPGWRVGYAAGRSKIIREMIKLQQYSFVCAPSVLQYGLLGALNIDMSSYLEDYRNKRDFICGELDGRYSFIKPGGAFYLFPEAPGGNGDEFAGEAIRKNLLIVPGSVFSEKNTHFRISFAASYETLNRGIEALKALV
jgi:aspartate aminotransferase/aminotransferase